MLINKSELVNASLTRGELPVANDTDVFCSICFALPGEKCRSKFIAYGRDQVMPIICRTHNARLVASHRHSIRQLFADQLLLAARKTLGNS
jgi:hypothetical protein